MVLKTALIIMVILILMEDGSSIRKTAEEEKEDQEILAAVNATLAEEEAERKKEEKKKQDHQEKERKPDQGKRKKEKEDKPGKQDRQDEACLPVNVSCPIVEPCQPCEDCPRCGICPEERPCKECPPCEECGPCPGVRPCRPCQPCGPCPVTNTTEVVLDQPPTVICSEVTGMPTAIAMAVGAAASLLVTGVAAIIGLVIRYFSPLECGFVFLATIIIVWYFSSQYPETARELGARAATLLREAATTISHRIVEAIRHHNEQVSSLFNFHPSYFLGMSSMFPKICTKIFYVLEN
jgi:hypothetical protein